MEDHEATNEALKSFYRILEVVVKADGSDVHLKPEAPVRARIHGALTALDFPWTTAQWLKDVIQRIVP
ncbi:MAG TPA: hypothetical protein VGY56_18255, partial [Verrucomicrobiae bacterium]|nr:hypothetical protein [Verrucomicrobiae bacterium]